MKMPVFIQSLLKNLNGYIGRYQPKQDNTRHLDLRINGQLPYKDFKSMYSFLLSLYLVIIWG
jgi:hypothetical protein